MHKSFAIAAAAALLVAATIDPARAAPDKSPTRSAPILQDGNCRGSGGTLKAFGLTADQRLICFSERNPAAARTLNTVSGLVNDTALIGIDVRVQDGKLYGLGNAGGVYRLDTLTAEASLVNRLGFALDGTAFGIDFNPAADRLRVVSNTGQNLRHDVNTGVTLNDDPLDYPPATPLNGIGPTAQGIVAVAYTNNDLDTNTGTLLFGIDTSLDQAVLIAPPNDGSLISIGKLTLDAAANVGFDIYTALKDGLANRPKALATVVNPDGRTGLFRINLATGRASSIGSFAAGERVIDIAIPLAQN